MSASQAIHSGAEIFLRAKSGINIAALRGDVKRPFRILLCGDPALIVDFRATLLRESHGHRPSLEAAALLETIAPQRRETIVGDDVKLIVFLGRPCDENVSLDDLLPFKVPILALFVDADGTPTQVCKLPVAGKVERVLVAGLDSENLRPRVFPFMAEAVKNVAVAVGHCYPVLREAICTVITRDTARLALKISAASAMVDQVPLLGFVIGTVASAGDIVAISALQMNLTMKVGSIYARDPDIGTVWELLPIIGGGLGWRALSRELAGFLPMAGLVIKSAIAYAGTMVVGEGAAFYYRTGRHMSAAQAAELYAETKRAAMDIAREMITRLRNR